MPKYTFHCKIRADRRSESYKDADIEVIVKAKNIEEAQKKAETLAEFRIRRDYGYPSPGIDEKSKLVRIEE